MRFTSGHGAKSCREGEVRAVPAEEGACTGLGAHSGVAAGPGQWESDTGQIFQVAVWSFKKDIHLFYFSIYKRNTFLMPELTGRPTGTW